jgi:TonB-linked SusC/RagA family outer membrane protein
MKLTLLFLTACFLQVSATVYSQNTKFTFDVKNKRVVDILRDIEDQSEFRFFYQREQVNVERKIDLDITEQTVENILTQIFSEEGIEFQVRNDNLILLKPAGMTFGTIEFLAENGQQQRTVSGKVTDNSGQPLPGVTVVIKGTTQGTVTNSDGNYSLSDIPEDATLVFSFVGMRTEEVVVGTQTSINVTLEADMIGIEEVVAVGYGTQKRSNLTGSVSDIGGDKLTQRNVVQTADALQGIAPGVNIDARSSQPGSQSSIRVRGEGTLTIGASASKNNPLVLIDGVEGNINDVEPSNIESISILKDAASAAIYGSRASNGVILINTKRGKDGELFVSYDGNIGYQFVTDQVEFSDGYEFMTHYNEALTNEGKTPAYDQTYIQNWQANQPSDEYPHVNWNNSVLKNSAFQQKHSLTVNGGSNKVRNLIMLNYLEQESVMPNTNFNRFGIRLNTDIQATDRLHFRLDFNGITSETTEPSQGVWYQLHRAKPVQLDRLTDGRYGVGYANINPLAMALDGGLSIGERKSAVFNARTEYQLTEDLNVEFTFAPTYKLYEGDSFIKMYDTYTWEGNKAGSYPAKNQLNVNFNKSQNIYSSALLRYQKSLEVHNFNIIAGFEQTEYYYKWTNAYRENFPLQDYKVLNAGDAAIQLNSGSAHEWSLRSMFGRFNYNLNEKYLFEANFRYDGSSRFAEGNKYSFFPSLSGGWRISEENFMTAYPFISNLKLRGSWGMLGNQQIGEYPFVSTVDLGTSHDVVFGEQSQGGASITTYSNRDIRWETTTITNFGLDLGLFNKLSILFDYYIKRTDDILLRLPIPATMGFSAPYQNAGSVENKGWDLAASYNNHEGEFRYGVSFMLSDVKNKVLDLKDTGPYNYTATTIREGEPINAIFGYEADGLFQTPNEVAEHAFQDGTVGPGDIRYKDQLTIDSDGDGIPDTADGVINADDRVVIGNQIPRFSYSLDLTAEYKGFDVRLFIQGIGKVDGYLDNDAIWAFYNGGKLQKWHIDSRWTPDNPNAEYPRYWIAYQNNQKASSYWMRSAAYLRLKNAQLGYTLPKNLTNKLKLDRLRIYIAGDNLLTLDDFYPGWDPETRLRDNDVHPFFASYTLGINVQF